MIFFKVAQIWEKCFFLSDVSRNKRTDENPQAQHRLVYTEEKRLRKCVYCYHKNVKTYSGHAVTSYFQCQACGVALCKTMRTCFVDFHKYIEESGNPIQIVDGRRNRSIKSEACTNPSFRSDGRSSVDTCTQDPAQEYTYCITLSSPESQWCGPCYWVLNEKGWGYIILTWVGI